MRRPISSIAIDKGDIAYLTRTLDAVGRGLAAMGLSLEVVDHAEFMAINRAYIDRRWYALHDHYGHERFIGLVAVDSSGEIAGTAATRPADLGGRSLGEAYDDLHFAYPGGVPAGAQDRFVGTPRALYSLRGKASYMGGMWLNPDTARSNGLGGSNLLSYISRACYALVLGTEDPDYGYAILVDEVLRGHDRGKSIAMRYGFRHYAPGPLWVNHYPDAAEKDLQLNTVWMDRAALMSAIEEEPWMAKLEAGVDGGDSATRVAA